MARAGLPPEMHTDGWEVGRLVVAPEYRSNAEVLKTCLMLTFIGFLEVTKKANAYATCTPVLGRLYRRFGFQVVQKEAVLKDGEPYSLIHGTVESVRQAVLAARAEPQQSVAPQPAVRRIVFAPQGVPA